jgi:hypothetical protein
MKAHFIRSCGVAMAAAMLLAVVSCAESYEGEDSQLGSGDTLDSEPSTEFESDTGFDNSDSGQCVPGAERPCCIDGRYADIDVVCDTAYNEQYSCAALDGCGGAQLVRYQPRYCSGMNYSCGGALGVYGDWTAYTSCQPHEVCVLDVAPDTDGEVVTTDPGLLGCQAMPSMCPIGWGQQVCFSGGSMDDCPVGGCPSPLPSLSLEGSVILDVGDLDGKAVYLTLAVKQRGGLLVTEPDPFHDIEAVLSHGGKVAPFYNFYDGNQVTGLGLVYRFPSEWFIPDFWGMDLGGEWTLDFVDHAWTNGESKFVVNNWCLTFLDPEGTVRTGSGQWSKTPGAVAGTLYNGTTVFEMNIEDYVEATDVDPVVCLAIKAADPRDVQVEMVAADGTVHMLKQLSDESIPESIPLYGLDRSWLTGRYKLSVTNNNYYASSDGDRLVGWSVNYKTACNLPEVPVDTDPVETDTGTGSDSGIDTDVDTGSDTQEDTSEDTGSQTQGTDATAPEDTGSQTTQGTDATAPEDTESQAQGTDATAPEDTGSQTTQDTDATAPEDTGA